MSSSKSIVSGVFWTTLVNIVNGVYGFISVPILIAYFGKSDYGLIGLAMSVNIYLRLLDLGFNSTNVRYFSNWLTKNNHEKVNKLFQTSLSFYGFIGLINALVLLIIALFSDRIFNITAGQDVIVKHLFYILSISAFVSWYTSCFEQLLKANEYVGWTQRMLLLPKLLQVVILICTVIIGFNIEWYYALTAFSMFIIIPLMVHKIRQLCPYVSFKPKFDKPVFKEVIKYSLNIFSFGLFQFTIINIRPVFLGMQCSSESIADYRILEGIVKIVMMMGGAFLGVLLPSSSKIIANNDRHAQDKIAYQGTRFVTIAICFCCFGIMSITPELLTAYVGDSYLYLALWLDLWLLATLSAHNQAISSLILANADIRAITYCTIFSSVSGIISCWFLIPYFEVGGTVIAYCIYCLIQMLFYYLYYWPRVMFINSSKVFLTAFSPYCFLGGVLALTLRNANIGELPVWSTMIIKGGAFAILFTTVVVLTFGKSDKDFIKRLVHNKHMNV